MAPVRLRRTDILDGLLATPLAAERLPDALVRAHLLRGATILLAVAPLYVLALDWGGWLELLDPILRLHAENPVWWTFRNFEPALWPEAIGPSGERLLSAQFGGVLLLSDLLMCWRAAALGTWLGTRLKSAPLALVLAASGVLPFCGLRLWFFAGAFSFHQYTVGSMERVMAAFALDLLVFALVTPFFLDRARKAAATVRE